VLSRARRPEQRLPLVRRPFGQYPAEPCPARRGEPGERAVPGFRDHALASGFSVFGLEDEPAVSELGRRFPEPCGVDPEAAG
jgi:hypothetical protein